MIHPIASIMIHPIASIMIHPIASITIGLPRLPSLHLALTTLPRSNIGHNAATKKRQDLQVLTVNEQLKASKVLPPGLFGALQDVCITRKSSVIVDGAGKCRDHWSRYENIRRGISYRSYRPISPGRPVTSIESHRPSDSSSLSTLSAILALVFFCPAPPQSSKEI
jgi:hypothetical protein